MNLLRNLLSQQQDEGFLNPFGLNTNSTSGNIVPEREFPSGTLPHIRMNFPEFEEESGVLEGLLDYEHQLAVFGIVNKMKEWPSSIEEENVEWKEELTDIQKRREVFRDPIHVANVSMMKNQGRARVAGQSRNSCYKHYKEVTRPHLTPYNLKMAQVKDQISWKNFQTYNTNRRALAIQNIGLYQLSWKIE